jgi:hypothetical protein
VSESISVDGRLAVGVAAIVIPRASQPVCDDNVSQNGPVETMMRVRRVAREYGIFAAVAVGLVGWLLRDAWLRGYVLGQTDVLFGLVPWKPYAPLGWRARMPLLSDAAVVFYPFLHFARDAIRAGHFPAWAPPMGGGRPLFAAFQSAVLSPFTIPNYLLPFPWSMAVDTGLRLLVGGFGMYALLRRWGVTAEAALFGGIAYLLNPYSVVWLEHPLSAVAAWVPWLLLAVDRTVDGTDARGVAFIALATAAALFSGHPETAFNVTMLAAGYACVRSLQVPRPASRLALVAAGMVIGTAVAAVQVVPFLEYAAHSRALDVRNAAAQPLATPALAFAAALVPDFYGHPLRHRFVLDGTNSAAQTAYPGLIVWLAAPLALLHRALRARAVFLLAAAALAFLIMYGTPVAAIARWLIPPLRIAASWSLACIPVAALGICAAVGLDVALVRADPARRRQLVISVLLIATAAVIAATVWFFLSSERDLLTRTGQWTATVNAISRGSAILVCGLVVLLLGAELPFRLAMALAVTILTADLLLFGDGLHPLLPPSYAYPPVPELAYLQKQPGLYRVAGWRLALPPNSAMVYGLEDIRSYDGVGLRRYEELLEIICHFNGTAFELVTLNATGLIDFLNLKYIVAAPDDDVPLGHFRVAYTGDSRVYVNEHVQERAFLADSYVIARGDEARRLLRQGPDLTRTAILEQQLAPELRPDAAGSGSGTATITQYGADRVDIRTNADGRRLLVCSDVYYPGWTATIDGGPVPVLLANYAFRAVSVPTGSHAVEFRYRPKSIFYGGFVSLLACAALVVLLRGPRAPSAIDVGGTGLRA